MTATPAARSWAAPSPAVNTGGSRQAKTTLGTGGDDVLDAGHRAGVRAPQGTSEL